MKSVNKTAGYSGTQPAKKLGIKPGHRVAMIDAPPGFETQLTGLPDDAIVTRVLRGKVPIDVIILFCKNAAALKKTFEKARDRLTQNGGLWIGWPKKASGLATDLDDGTVRKFGLSTGLVDNKVCAIDATWSGLRYGGRAIPAKRCHFYVYFRRKSKTSSCLLSPNGSDSVITSRSSATR